MKTPTPEDYSEIEINSYEEDFDGLWAVPSIRVRKIIKKTLSLKEQEVMNRLVKENVKEACHTLAKDDKALTEISKQYLKAGEIEQQAKQEN